MPLIISPPLFQKYYPNLPATTKRVSGVVTTHNSIQAGALVKLYRRGDGLLLQQTFSNNLGQYSFNVAVDNTEYMIISNHPGRLYNAVIQDMVKAV